MITVPLDKNRHDRKRFDCEVKALNNYLRLMENQQSNRDNTRTFVLDDAKAIGSLVLQEVYCFPTVVIR